MIEARYRLLVFSIVCLGVLAIVQNVARPDLQRRNYEFMPEMVESVAAESQSAFAALPGGLTRQSLVPGVVVRGSTPFRYGVGAEEELRAGRELTNPFADDDADTLARGAEVYRIYCLPCHAADGGGQGPVVQRGMPPPTSFKGANAMQMTDGSMFHVLTVGRNNMASYAGQVSVPDRWKVIRHIRQLQESSR